MVAAVFSKKELSASTNRPGLVLSIGYPIFIFLLLIFPSTSRAREAFIGIAIAYAWLNRHDFSKKIEKLPLRLITLLGLLLISYVTLSVFWSTPPVTRTPLEQFRIGMYVCVFWLLSNLYFRHNGAALKHLYWIVGLGIIGNLLGASLTTRGFLPGDRLTGYGILNNPILLGSLTVVQTTIGLHLQYRTTWERIAGICLLSIAILVTILSASRGPILALTAVIAIWFIWTVRLKATSKLLLCISGICILAAGSQTAGIMDTLTERGTSFRPLIWLETLRASQQHWLFGWGWANNFSQSPVNEVLAKSAGNAIVHPHSLFISSLYYGGLIGLLLHILFLVMVAQVAFHAKERGLAFGLLAAILLLTASDTYSIVTKRDYIWLIVWMPISILMTRQRRAKTGHQ